MHLAQDDDVPRWGAALEVDTIDGRDITVESFLENYANKGVPVVLTNLAVQGGMFGKTAWTGSHLASKLQGKKATLRRRVKESHDWANLEDGKTGFVPPRNPPPPPPGRLSFRMMSGHALCVFCSWSFAEAGYLFWADPDDVGCIQSLLIDSSRG